MTSDEPRERDDGSPLRGLPGDSLDTSSSLQEAARSFADKLNTLNDELAASPETVEEVRTQLNATFRLAQTERLSNLVGQRGSDVSNRLASNWDSLRECYRSARHALQQYEAVADPFAQALDDEQQNLEDRIRAMQLGTPLREAALSSSELFYEKLVPLLGAL